MKLKTHETWSRRQWLRSLGRWLALGGFAGLSARLLVRGGAARGCPRGVTTCGGCPLAADCMDKSEIRNAKSETTSNDRNNQ